LSFKDLKAGIGLHLSNKKLKTTMKKRTVLLKAMFASGAIILLLLLSSCTKEVFTSGEKKEFTLQSVANGASYHIEVGLPQNYNSLNENNLCVRWGRTF
jgi:hypothetical protein